MRIKGTENVNQITEEVLLNHQKIENITGKVPKFFRSGTAYYDEVGVKVANEIGEHVVNINVLEDAGATYKRASSGCVVKFKTRFNRVVAYE
ncbi:MAG: hypothetical protein ACQEWV_27680 [Bacillota bacterium]